MGIKNLWPKLNEFAKETSLQKLHECIPSSSKDEKDDNSIKQIKLGIDISFWMKHNKSSWNSYYAKKDKKFTTNLILRTIFYRLCKLTTLSNIIPIFVFDGFSRPEKRGNISSTSSSRTDRLLFGKLEVQVRELIEAFGIVFLQAPGEAEAELADLNKRGLLDAILSDDGDCFMFGAKIVVRNWGEKLGSNLAYRSKKALNADKQKKKKKSQEKSDSSESDLLSTSSEEEDNEEGIVVKETEISTQNESNKTIMSKDQITFYRIEDFAKGVNATSCMLLIVLLGGGDYDMEGVRQCGIQTAVGLAKAGFDQRLMEGIKNHLRPPKGNDHMPEIISKMGWEKFIENWKEDMKEELISGRLGKRYLTLAKSEAFSKLLSTPESLRILAAYVWPTVSNRDSIPDQKPIRIERVTEVAGTLLNWTKDFGLKTMRNCLFPGCIAQWLLGFPIEGFTPLNSQSNETNGKSKESISLPTTFPSIKASQSPKKSGKVKNHGQDLRAMFTVASKSTIESVENTTDNKENLKSRIILEIFKERSGEIYVEFAVESLVAITAKALDISLIKKQSNSRSLLSEEEEEDELQSSTQSESNFSELNTTPGKPKKPFNAYEPIRIWIKLDVFLTNKEGKKMYETFQKKMNERDRIVEEKKIRQERSKANQSSQQKLSTFFRSQKPVNGGLVLPKVGQRAKPIPKKKSHEEAIDQLIAKSSSPSASPSKRKARQTPHASSDSLSLSSENESQEGEETILGIASSSIETKANVSITSDDSVEFISMQNNGKASSNESQKYGQIIEILD